VPRTVPFVTCVTAGGITTSHITDRRPIKVSFLTPEILYIDLSRVNLKELQAALLKARQVRGLVFDCRGELRLPVQSFLACLSDSPIPSPQFLLPVIRQPDFQAVTFQSLSFSCKPQAPRIKAKTVFVCDENSAGNMETALAMVQNSRLGTVVGSPSAGTAGGIALASLPGNYFVSWTGIKTLKPDGARMHGVGIKPDKPAGISHEGIRAGRDELLEAAMAELKRE
jgi:C-terminal processing protease CtpA/Prc